MLQLLVVALAVAALVHKHGRRRGRHHRPAFALGLHIAVVKGTSPMSNIQRPGQQCLDTEKILLALAATARVDAGGAPIDATDYTWASSDESVVKLEDFETAPDGTTSPLDPFTRWARTPLPGVATITVTHVPSGNTETMDIAVGKTAPGEIGLSAGTPVTE